MGMGSHFHFRSTCIGWVVGGLLWALLLVALSGATTPSAAQRTAARVQLGTLLLADQRLSASGQVACLDCHQPAKAYTDGRTTATPGGLNTPTLWGLNNRAAFGWFSPEVTTLEAMVLRPLADAAEMGPLSAESLDRLNTDPHLVAAYGAAFPGEPIGWKNTTQALAAALRVLVAPDRPYDRWLAGDAEALSPEALRGERLFGEIGCASCHRPPAFATDSYLALGIVPSGDRNTERARVPSLRGVRLTAPYFHDGSAPTLLAVLRAYERGGEVPGAPSVVGPILLTAQDRADLVAFLESL